MVSDTLLHVFERSIRRLNGSSNVFEYQHPHKCLKSVRGEFEAVFDQNKHLHGIGSQSEHPISCMPQREDLEDLYIRRFIRISQKVIKMSHFGGRGCDILIRIRLSN